MYLCDSFTQKVGSHLVLLAHHVVLQKLKFTSSIMSFSRLFSGKKGVTSN